MPIAAKYENGVFKPLEDVAIKEGALVDVYIRNERRPNSKRPSIRDLGFAGMWADRDDIGSGIEYENQIRDHARGE